MLYKKEHTREISFPLGGIGTGCIGLAGNGRLIDWEIFNRPAKGRLNGFTHFAIRAENPNKVLDARILNGDLYGAFTGHTRPFDGENACYGFGTEIESMAGLPHFKECNFRGEFPVAKLDFRNKTFPGKVRMTAFNPFIPSNDRDSSAPAAFFEFTIRNTTAKTLQYRLVACLSNPFSHLLHRNVVEKKNGVTMLKCLDEQSAPDSLEYGDLTLATDAEKVSYQTYWYRGLWVDPMEAYWHDMFKPGDFKDRNYPGNEIYTLRRNDVGLLAASVKLKPGEEKQIRFVISWNFPWNTNYWTEDIEKKLAGTGLKNRWKNYYATVWENSIATAEWALANWGRLADDTFRFKQALFESSLPPAALDAVSSCLATLKTPTVLRLEDGTFYGWEGAGVRIGSCAGSCTHVWNYQQALPFLFPALERSMRDANFAYNVDEKGESAFRLSLPLGLRQPPSPRSCIDGHFGEIIKVWRDWKISGDDKWLDRLYPKVKTSLTWAWNKQNPDLWDVEKSGVITGRQHHTLDMELFGPSAWLNGFYLAALKCAAEMARHQKDDKFATELDEIFEWGYAWTNKNLFNGEYFHQKVDLTDAEQLKKFDGMDGACSEKYWSEEHKQLKYQIGGGLNIDAALPQWFATMYGIGDVLDPDKVKSTLKANFKHGFRKMRDVANFWRLFALQDEAGAVICTWPRGKRPIIPLTYHSETMTGFEYALASHMLRNGMTDEALEIITAVRDRYDGLKRNPWNEIECGSHYARAMAAYALILDFSGFEFDLRRGHLGFAPLVSAPAQFFWSVDGAWGMFRQSKKSAELELLYGELSLRTLGIAKPAITKLAGKDISSGYADGCVKFDEPIKLSPGDKLQLKF